MAKTFTAPFAQTPKTASCVATASFALTGTNSILDSTPVNTMLLMTAGSDGSLVTSVKAITRATNTATMGALFIRRAAEAPANRHLFSTISIAAQSVSATNAISEFSFTTISESSPLRLGAGDELYFGIASTQNNGIVAHVAYTDF